MNQHGERSGARDRAKAAKAVAALFLERPKGVKAFVATYVLGKRAEARAALGMPDVEGEDEALDLRPVANCQGREPGEDG